MLYNDHWDKVKERMQAYWAREAMDRCCVQIQVPKPGYIDNGEGNLYYDIKRSDQVQRRRFENHTFIGEALPCAFPYFGTAAIAEYTGCKPNMTPETTWFDPWLEEPDADQISYSVPEAFEKQKNAMAEFVERSQGDYLVSAMDNCGIVDALAQIRGNENLLMDMFTDPGFVEKAVQKLLPIYKKTQDEQFAMIRENNEGSSIGWMQMWAPGRLAQMQCDLSVMISPEMFNRLVMPELEELTAYLEYPLYHFDGMEQIRHLDSLLSLKKLRAIQWTPVAGQPKTSEFMPQLQKIQKAGKNLLLYVQPQEVVKILDSLSSRGLVMRVDGIRTLDEANEMMRLVKKHSKDRG